MPAELRRIPGVVDKRRRPSRPRQREVIAPWQPGPPRPPRSPRSPFVWELLAALRPRRKVVAPRGPFPWTVAALTVGYIALGLFVVNAFWSATRVHVRADAIEDDAALTSGALAERTVRFSVDPGERVDRAELLLDGKPASTKTYDIEGTEVVWKPGKLPEGKHEVELSVPRPMLGRSTFSWGFRVDDTPPRMDVPGLLPPSDLCKPVTIQGKVERGATLTLDDKPLAHKNGAFTLRYDRAPTVPLRLAATDRAGNRSQMEVISPVRYPGGQGVHMTAVSWAYEPLRRDVLALIDAGLVSAVELDLKDESGVVGYDSKVPLALQIGAVQPEYSIKQTVSDLKRRGVRVIGRIVAFRDQPLVEWAWQNGKRDWVVQSADGAMLGTYGGFSNPAHPEVHRYNLDIALEATAAGVDDILWDYVRRPEGDPETMVFPGIQGSVSDATVQFLATSRAALNERCAFQGVSVFGIAADRPDAVGQDVPRIARNVDYIAPMLYPSHWVPGEYRVKNPN
ncbi:MAG: putative glycoside hydrolase, partial [Actinobacteria bacterium]|nr:putative glycoside hydrolase [Actinomycetota bacterium]